MAITSFLQDSGRTTTPRICLQFLHYDLCDGSTGSGLVTQRSFQTNHVRIILERVEIRIYVAAKPFP